MNTKHSLIDIIRYGKTKKDKDDKDVSKSPYKDKKKKKKKKVNNKIQIPPVK